MKIKLIGEEIEIVKIEDDEYKELDGDKNIGVSVYAKNKIVINNQQSFEVLIHEMVHCWLYRIGISSIKLFSKESICDIIGSMINNLVRENGVDIIKRLERYAVRR